MAVTRELVIRIEEDFPVVLVDGGEERICETCGKTITTYIEDRDFAECLVDVLAGNFETIRHA